MRGPRPDEATTIPTSVLTVGRHQPSCHRPPSAFLSGPPFSRKPHPLHPSTAASHRALTEEEDAMMP